jgi:hypothetical protein
MLRKGRKKIGKLKGEKMEKEVEALYRIKRKILRSNG